MAYKYDERGLLICSKCGSHKFILVAELLISHVSKDCDDPIANRTIESERIISLICAKCRQQIK